VAGLQEGDKLCRREFSGLRETDNYSNKPRPFRVDVGGSHVLIWT